MRQAEALLIPAAGVLLPADLSLPDRAGGLVVFVHGSGSSRFSPRNRAVAAVLQQAGLATILFDLLTASELERDRLDQTPLFRLDLWRDRLLDILVWLSAQPELAALLPVGLFGASSGAAVALQVAAARPDAVAAVVSRGGRPDLAGVVLPDVLAPTLLIVGGEDEAVLRLNRLAAQQLACPHRLEVIPGASHLFEQPGTLDEAARLTRDWFLRRLPGRAPFVDRPPRHH